MDCCSATVESQDEDFLLVTVPLVYQVVASNSEINDSLPGIPSYPVFNLNK